MMSLATRIEALLFASDQPLPIARLCEVLDVDERSEVQAALDALAGAYADPERAFRLVQVAGGWQIATKPEYATVIRRLFTGKRRVRLTKAALETLAIIAYKQPTTRPEVDAIRGVASGGVLETLLERNLIRIAGRSDGIGRPLLYGTTPEFLHYLGINRLEDLPSLEELESMLAEREAAARLADEEEMQELAGAARSALPPGTDPSEIAAARLEVRLREHDLPTIEELDAELRERGARMHELAAQVAAERARLAEESGEVEAPESASPAALLAPVELAATELAAAEPADAARATEAAPGPEPTAAPEPASEGDAPGPCA
jgi:segregation and condensation protein B